MRDRAHFSDNINKKLNVNTGFVRMVSHIENVL